MQVTSNGKVRRSAGEWSEVFSRWERSGLTPRGFCRKEKIQLSSFRRWRQKLNDSPTGDDFVAVTAAPPSTSSWSLEVTLPDGTTLRFQG